MQWRQGVRKAMYGRGSSANQPNQYTLPEIATKPYFTTQQRQRESQTRTALAASLMDHHPATAKRLPRLPTHGASADDFLSSPQAMKVLVSEKNSPVRFFVKLDELATPAARPRFLSSRLNK
jgi:hypothetical protein